MKELFAVKDGGEEIQKVEVYRVEGPKTYILIITNKGVYQEVLEISKG